MEGGLGPGTSPMPAPLAQPPGTLGLARGSLLGCSPYSAKQARSSLGMSDSGIGEGLASALSRESLSSGVGEGSQLGRAPSPGDKKGFWA